MAFNVTNGTTYGKANDSSRYGSFSYNETYTKYNTTETFFYETPNTILEELALDSPLLGYRVNLPNDVIGIGASNLCTRIQIQMSCRLFNNNTFSVYTSYGHKFVGGKAEISLKDANIKFNSSCDNYDGKMLSETSAKL